MLICPACEEFIGKSPCRVCGYDFNQPVDDTKVKKIRNKISGSLGLPRTKAMQRERVEYWDGYITGLRDYDVLTLNEYQILNYRFFKR